MEGPVSWPQLIFAAVLVCGSFSIAAWVILKLAEILVRLERLATKDDLSSTKAQIYTRIDAQWNSFMQAHDDHAKRINAIEIRLGPNHGGRPPLNG